MNNEIGSMIIEEWTMKNEQDRWSMKIEWYTMNKDQWSLKNKQGSIINEQ